MPTVASVSRRVLRVAVEIIVAIYIIADSAISLLFRPFMRLLSSLRIIQRLERAIDALPPYVILVLLVVPFIIAELAKVFALFWMSEGHFHSGMTILISAYIVSIFGCERMLHAGKNKLMTIGWFATIYGWIMAVRDHIFGWMRQTLVWKAGLELRGRVQSAFKGIQGRLRSVSGKQSVSGKKPRSALER